MKISWSLAVGITGLVLILSMGPSWGQVPPDNDRSDPIRGNTGGGTGALSGNGGLDNTGYGRFALMGNSSSGNVAVGIVALANGNRGNNNTAVGRGALANQEDGSNNVAVGWGALANLGIFGGEGTNNIAIGMEAGLNLTSGNGNIYLSARGDENESNTIRLGRNQARTFIAGIGGVEMSDARTVVINPATLQLGVAPLTPSSARYKRDIETMGTRSQGLLQLRPVTFRYKEDAQGKLEYGLIAEEVAEVYPELVTRGDNGQVESVRYHALIPMLLNELQHQQGQLGTQAEQLSVLKADNERLRAMVAQQQERDEALAARLERIEAAAAPATLANR